MLSLARLKFVLAAVCLLLLAAVLSADLQNGFRPTEKAYYADAATLNFVRPGLIAKITKAEITSDNLIKAYVKFTDPKGLPLDREGIYSPGPISMSFGIAAIPSGQTQYVSYLTRQRTGAAGTVTQATSENTGTWTKTADGEYTYTFANKAPGNYDKNATHMVAMWGSRDLRDFDLNRNYADAVYDFVPSGASAPQPRDIVRTATCNKCHDQLGLHGGSRRTIQVCDVCHTPQTSEAGKGNTVDLKVMIHKIHMGSSLPSVQAGTHYTISSADYSDVVNPSPNQACQVCHEPKSVSGAAQADNWLTKPSRDACGSCHDNVNFASGKNHLNLPQVSDNLCANCHQPKTDQEFDASIMGAHVVPTHSAQLQGVNFKIESVKDAVPGKKPTVTFTVKDDKGNPIALSGMNSTRLYMAGSTTTDFGSYVREDAIKAPGTDGRYTYTFTAAIPADAKGTWQFGMEGYRNVKLNAGTSKETSARDLGHNVIFIAAVDGSQPVARRAIVDTAKCEKCHMSLEFHGGNRNTAQMCSFCHNPTLTVKEANGTTLSYNFPNMIHRFHAEARYPGNLNNCEQCHVSGAQSLPLQEGLLSTVNPAAPDSMSPTAPETNACMSCHGENASAWSHAKANTTQFGESCAVCHGTGKEFAVTKVHAQ